MERRQLGRTKLDVSAIGLGTEYLKGQPRETVLSVIRQAIEQGVNYFDVVFSFPDYLDDLGAALKGHRQEVILTGHLGSTVKNGQYFKTRNVKHCESFFLDLLARLGTDHVDVLFLHNCNPQKDYDKLMSQSGPLGLAKRLQQEGKARYLGFSGHSVTTALQAVESGHVDVLMFPINLAANAVPGKKELLQACAAGGVGVVAMKPYAGGKLLSAERTVRMGGYQMGGEALKLKKTAPITPVQCLAYVLSQVGVATAVPGCANEEHLRDALAYGQASSEERDFSSLLADFQQYAEGECVYCNHCLPCPAAIDIGQVMRLLDMAQQRMSAGLRAAYAALPANASDCTRCGACEARCPFGVSVMARMEQAGAAFG
ncbi:MAG: aldo/keto reductase [Thermoflexales bacterium]|nr:aldo/keto reductase [Thermoflexales bacterium]